MIDLFEYQNKVEFPGSFLNLEEFLDGIWSRREKSNYYSNNEDDKIEVQQFIQFLHKTNELKSNKYVGVIHFENQRINLLPKIFYQPDKDYSSFEINAIQNHILWWLSYCRKIKFPNYQTSISSMDGDFFEILIYLFSKYTRELLSYSVYQQYEEVEGELSFIKGRLNADEYINNNISQGRWHKLNCTWDSFAIDNKFNRIIKYVSKLLLNVSRSSENKQFLKEILFILDEVSDVTVKAEDCLNIRFNPIFESFETVRDYCYLFLENSISIEYKSDLKLFTFLLPMEYVFEDFVYGFIEKELKDINVWAQTKSIYLDNAEDFQLRPDLILELNTKKIIADTKYKIVYQDKEDPKKGISQNDLYQMLSYAVRFKINEIKLFYPETFLAYNEQKDEIIIKDELADGVEIVINAYQLPILNRELFLQADTYQLDLNRKFESTRINLRERISSILS